MIHLPYEEDEGAGTELAPSASQLALKEAVLFEQLMGLTPKDILDQGKKALWARLSVKVILGTASHQELAIYRNVLRDNGMTLGIDTEDGSKAKVIEHAPLPTFEDD